MITSIVIGLIVGAIAKLLMPGKDPGGIFVTILIGLTGSMIAYWVGWMTGIYATDQTPGWIASILGSMLLLLIYRRVVLRGTETLI